MLGGIVGIGMIGGAVLAGRMTFWGYYDARRIRQIHDRAVDPEKSKQDVLMLLHDYNRNVGPARARDVAGILGAYVYGVLWKLQDEDLIRFDERGWISPGKQLATHGSFVMMSTGGQG
jgi:hypothetical protein